MDPNSGKLQMIQDADDCPVLSPSSWIEAQQRQIERLRDVIDSRDKAAGFEPLESARRYWIPGPFSPHWVDAAKRLMNQAADALDAANVAINEYRLGTASQPSRSQQLADAGYTKRDTRLVCDECGRKFTPQMLPIHRCKADLYDDDRITASQPKDVVCNCDDHDARYCVNRASRTSPCVCRCHGASDTAVRSGEDTTTDTPPTSQTSADAQPGEAGK